MNQNKAGVLPHIRQIALTNGAVTPYYLTLNLTKV